MKDRKRCPLCEKPYSGRGYILRDDDGVNCGIYCSKQCAWADAWGPRFRRFSVRIERTPRNTVIVKGKT